MPVLLPPPEEQRRIASEIDRETARIDALIEKKTRFIELLKEKRQALIMQAVTKGLDPTVPMKDSGVEWIGEVPAHWEVSRVRYLSRKIGSGKTPSGGATVYVNQGVLFLRSQNVHDDGLRLDDVSFITDKIDAEMAGSRVRPGDVLLNITGASIGRTSIVPGEFPAANVNQHVCIVRPRFADHAPWLHLSFCATSTKLQVTLLQTGSGREGLNFGQVGNFVVVVPPVEEITQVLSIVSKRLRTIDAAVQAVENSVGLLRERRSALITAAVTGQIDLREDAA
jgi:type I restriction enzyme S subunit